MSMAVFATESALATSSKQPPYVTIVEGGKTLTSIDQARKSSFAASAKLVLQAIAAEDCVCSPGAAEAEPVRRITFHATPMISAESGPVATGTPVESGERAVDTPWLVMSVSSSGGTCACNWTVNWNERQFLIEAADIEQAFPSPPPSLSQAEFDAYAKIYADAEILKTGSAGAMRTIPPDMLWLFRQTPQSTRGPFGNAAIVRAGAIVADRQERYVAGLAALIRHAACDARKTPRPAAITIRTASELYRFADQQQAESCNQPQ